VTRGPSSEDPIEIRCGVESPTLLLHFLLRGRLDSFVNSDNRCSFAFRSCTFEIFIHELFPILGIDRAQHVYPPLEIAG
jgi:hypothetical protein